MKAMVGVQEGRGEEGQETGTNAGGEHTLSRAAEPTVQCSSPDVQLSNPSEGPPQPRPPLP